MLDRQQCLGILGLRPSSTQQEIKQAYHDLVKVWHPDRFAHDPALGAKAEAKLKEINEAYETLMRLPEERQTASGTGRYRAYSQEPAVRRKRSEQPFWDKPVVMFFFILLFSALLFKISYFVFRGGFHSSAPGKTVRDIA